MDFPDIFRPFDKLIAINVAGKAYQVPENNTLLRCFQYIAMESVSYGDFCWNGECLNCQVTVRKGDKEKSVIACRVDAWEGMEIINLPDEIDLDED